MSDDDAEFLQWLSTLPEHVREVVRRYPPGQCYRSTEQPRAHYKITSYSGPVDKPVTVTLAHGRDSTLPGVATFGQNPAQLVPCGCGQWRPPSDEQVRATRARLERQMHERN